MSEPTASGGSLIAPGARTPTDEQTEHGRAWPSGGGLSKRSVNRVDSGVGGEPHWGHASSSFESFTPDGRCDRRRPCWCWPPAAGVTRRASRRQHGCRPPPDVVELDPAADTAANQLPDVVVDDVINGNKVNLRNVAPADTPILLWMYAPH